MKAKHFVWALQIFFLSANSFAADDTAAPITADPSVAASSTALTEEAAAITSSSATLATNISTAAPALAAKAKTLAATLASYKETQESCRSKETLATTYCLEKTNPGIAKSLPIIQTIIAAVGTSISDSCSKMAQALNIANEALLLYQTTCAATKGVCQYTCSGASTTLSKAKTEFTALAKQAKTQCAVTNAQNPAAIKTCETGIDTPLLQLTTSIDKDTNAKMTSSVAQKNTTCSGYSAQLASAVVGTIGVIKSISSANSCDTDSSVTASTTVDCTLAANATNSVCICLAAPRTAGCSEGLDTSTAALAADSLRAASTGDYTPTTSSGTLDVGDDTASTLGTAATTSSSGSTAPSSAGGNPLSGSGGGANSTAEVKAAQKAAGFNTNILSGEASGGGSGGSWGTGSSASDSLRAYLPGGAKDPNSVRGLAGQGVAKEITSQGGKSNWEKVRDRYRDNKSTLIDY